MRSAHITRAAAVRVLAPASVLLALAAPFASAATGPSAPVVRTGGTDKRVSLPAAELEGTIDPEGQEVTYYFQYGPTTAYGSVTPEATIAAGTTKVKVEKSVYGVAAGYRYRLVAKTKNGTITNGRSRTITTSSSTAKTAFELPRTYPAIPQGDTFVLAGTLTGAGNVGRELVLQESPYPYTAAYADVGAPIRTTVGGRFAFSVAKLKTSTKFRVATVAAKPLYSPVVPQHVSVRVLLKARTSKAARGLVRLYGTVTPAEVGARVFLQLERVKKSEGGGLKPEKPARLEKQRKGSGKGEKRAEKKSEKENVPSFSTKFTTVAKRATRSLSRFSIVVKVQSAGRYRAYVQVAPGALVSGTSQTVQLSAAASAKKKKRRKAAR